ncbi:MAG: HAMP domain-containing sensor histidine kinase [Elusimicrobia bacterium]|nr:HAMP domain-containing sensor histidine kinase [Elusimicrobiota bacterium]
MRFLQEQLRRRFEFIYVLAIILSGGCIHYLVRYKLAFLNLYAIPVLMAAYYLDTRKTLLGAFACILLTMLDVALTPERFLGPGGYMELYFSLFTWGAFLLLAAILVDFMKKQLVQEIAHGKGLGQEIVALKELDALKDRFTRSVSHDLKAPLNAVQAYAQLMRSGTSGALSQAQQRQLNIICSSTEEMARLIDEILDFSKMRAGLMQFHKAPVEVRDILHSVHELQKVNADKFGIQFLVDAQEPLPQVCVDKVQIVRVVTNLVFNAFKFTPSGGKVEISARRDSGAQVLLQVRDSGAGIPPHLLESIFDQFFQVSDTRKKARTVGTGLGLAISREIVQSHGGKIWAESGNGDGSLFSFTLPAAVEAAAPPPAAEGAKK